MQEPRIHTRRTTAPTVEPVTAEELVEYLRTPSGAEDLRTLTRLEKTAREWVEKVTHRSLLSQQWEMVFDGEPLGIEIELRRAPLISVQSVKSYSTGDVETVFDSSLYTVDVPGSRIWLKEGGSWPTDLRDFRSLVIAYTAGYGAAALNVPEEIRHAIMMLAGFLYENREAMASTTEGGLGKIPLGVTDLLVPYMGVEALV